jgi:putative FmdB family regulatory protein
MPLYEYHCPGCSSEFELLIRGQEQPVCPTCGGKQLSKLLSVPAAPSAGSKDLPICGPSSMPTGGCGLPQCGTGVCAGGWEVG